MRPRFDQQLEELNLELIKMGSLCERGIRKAVDLLMEENTNASIKDVDIIEEEINQKERDIETLCMRLLLQQQPVATDLRNISSALKMISDMERIGDQAQDIANMAEFVKVPFRLLVSRRLLGLFRHAGKVAFRCFLDRRCQMSGQHACSRRHLVDCQADRLGRRDSSDL